MRLGINHLAREPRRDSGGTTRATSGASVFFTALPEKEKRMRSARVGFWTAVFLAGACIPAFCQVIVPPNISGRTITADAGASAYQQSVYSTGNFDVSLTVFRNAQLRFAASGVVCTSGPLTNVSINVPFQQFGLSAGDVVVFLFSVRHRGTEGNTWSSVLTIIPVVAGSTPPTTTPPTTTSKSDAPGSIAPAFAMRREDEPAL
jgi:hypothetical protein